MAWLVMWDEDRNKMNEVLNDNICKNKIYDNNRTKNRKEILRMISMTVLLFYLTSDNIIVLKERLTLVKNVYCKADITELKNT